MNEYTCFLGLWRLKTSHTERRTKLQIFALISLYRVKIRRKSFHEKYGCSVGRLVWVKPKYLIIVYRNNNNTHTRNTLLRSSHKDKSPTKISHIISCVQHDKIRCIFVAPEFNSSRPQKKTLLSSHSSFIIRIHLSNLISAHVTLKSKTVAFINILYSKHRLINHPGATFGQMWNY